MDNMSSDFEDLTSFNQSTSDRSEIGSETTEKSDSTNYDDSSFFSIQRKSESGFSLNIPEINKKINDRNKISNFFKDIINNRKMFAICSCLLVLLSVLNGIAIIFIVVVKTNNIFSNSVKYDIVQFDLKKNKYVNGQLYFDKEENKKFKNFENEILFYDSSQHIGLGSCINSNCYIDHDTFMICEAFCVKEDGTEQYVVSGKYFMIEETPRDEIQSIMKAEWEETFKCIDYKDFSCE